MAEQRVFDFDEAAAQATATPLPEPDWFSEEQNADLPPRARRPVATVYDAGGRV